MKMKRLGRTDIEVFPIAFGGIPIQRISEEEAIKVVRRAIELGINLIDTARAYSDSEVKIGKALKGIDKKVFLSSKSFGRTKDEIYADVKVSLKNLGVKKIDIYHMHAVNDKETLNKVMSPDGAYYGLLKAKEEGLIDFIAVSTHNVDIAQELIKTDKFDVIQVCYNFIETEAEEKVFPLAKEKDVGIIAMKPMGGGVVPNPTLSLKFVLQNDYIVPDPGMESIKEVEENVRLVHEISPLTKEELQEIERIKNEMGQAFCRRCDYCQPCPQGIAISTIIRADSFIKRFPKEYLKEKWFYEQYLKAKTCTKCGVCATRCPYNLPIPDLIEKNVRLLEEYLA
ncbi:MAG: aldo/keto reductase [Synergistetes bacterium]|nr:aldo/keto reductase [Synergistota bacterium]